ncbi:radical SAM protein [candidate division WOR-3 bacterium]|nr:radical SAM protein [candidate division WOR-3 bacterium]
MSDRKVKIAWYGKHFGEEPPLVGKKPHGAGTIFFSGCNLRCVFCQNYQISQEKLGKEYSASELANIMVDLQDRGAVNIDLVTPTPWRRSLKESIILARESGLTIPIVWNSNAYETLHIIREMEGLVDIYLPDFKYADDKLAVRYSNAPKYSRLAEEAIKEMYRQVGNLRIKNGVAQKGLIIRHLILPGYLDNSFAVLERIALIDKDIHLSLMSQYYPVYIANQFPEINRRLTEDEIKCVEAKRMELGLENGWTQEADSGEIFLPDFRKKNPFYYHTKNTKTQRKKYI